MSDGMEWLGFATESHMLAHLFEEPDAAQINAYRVLMKAPTLTMAALTHVSTAVCPGALPDPEKPPDLIELLRTVNVGIAAVQVDLEAYFIKDRPAIEAQKRSWLAYTLHRALYELQPFRSPGPVSPAGVNGIVGRAAWLWTMGGIEGPFLTTWYQQSLRFGGVVTAPAKEN